MQGLRSMLLQGVTQFDRNNCYKYASFFKEKALENNSFCQIKGRATSNEVLFLLSYLNPDTSRILLSKEMVGYKIFLEFIFEIQTLIKIPLSNPLGHALLEIAL